MHEVWVRMQEDGFVPSDRLKGIMAAPFVAEEKPIPFHVPLEGNTKESYDDSFFIVSYDNLLKNCTTCKRKEILFNRTTKG
jgi:hypothetical protein